MLNSTRKKSITITLDPKLLEQAKEEANKEGRSLSNFIQFLIAKELNKK